MRGRTSSRTTCAWFASTENCRPKPATRSRSTNSSGKVASRWLAERFGQKLDQLIGADASDGIAVVEQSTRQLALGSMHLDDAIFDAVLGDQPVHRDRSLLTDAVCAIGGLCLHCGIPPWVEVNHVVRGRQIQPETA